jgi:hypothetical protein
MSVNKHGSKKWPLLLMPFRLLSFLSLTLTVICQ